MRALIAGVMAFVAMGGCSNERGRDNPAGAARPATDGQLPAGGEWFVERAAESGLDFVHFNGMSGEFYDAEIFAPGVALLDYDNDGDLDVYLVQGQMLGKGKTVNDALFPPQKGPLKDRLYRNDLVVNANGTRTLH